MKLRARQAPLKVEVNKTRDALQEKTKWAEQKALDFLRDLTKLHTHLSFPYYFMDRPYKNPRYHRQLKVNAQVARQTTKRIS
jgi:hypothetical protein